MDLKNPDNLFVTKREKFNDRWTLVRSPKELTPKQREILMKELEKLTRKIVLRKLRSEVRYEIILG